jgi:hypothetical protein
MNTIERELIYQKIKSDKKPLIEITPTYIKNLIKSKIDTDISVKSRTRPHPYYRCVYYKLCKDFTKFSLAEIGSQLNPIDKYDHATVLHGLKRFDEWKDQNWFITYYKFYKALSLTIYKEKNQNKDNKEFETIDDVKQYYKLNFIKLVEKYRSIINKQSKQLYNLKNDEVINEIAKLDNKKIESLKPRLEAFLLMNK